MGFMSVAGLNITVDVIAYREGAYNTTAHPYDTRILTTEGWKRNGDIEVGDRVIDPYGQDSKVVALYPQPAKPVYRLTTYAGATAEACHEHLWDVEWANQFNRSHGFKKETLTTLQVKDLVDKGRHVRLPEVRPAQFDAIAELPIDPYLMGLLLAEGSLEAEGVSFASADQEIVDRIRENLPAGHKLVSTGVKHRISVGLLGRANKDANLVLKAMRDLGLTGHRAWEKFIPDAYKFASVEDRLELLRGYLDGDGSIKEDGNIRVSRCSKRLAGDVQEVVRSLGGNCRVVHVTDKTYKVNGEVRTARDEYRINGIALRMNPFWLPRKADRYRFSQKALNQYRRVRAVDFSREDTAQCLEVSADSHLFVVDGFLPSHNTQKMPGQADFSPITLTHGVAVGQAQDIRWMQNIFTVIQGTGSLPAGTDFRRNVDVAILDHPVTTSTVPINAGFRIYNSWPTSISYSDLDAGANQLFIEQMSLAHEGWDFVLSSTLGADAPKFLDGSSVVSQFHS